MTSTATIREIIEAESIVAAMRTQAVRAAYAPGEHGNWNTGETLSRLPIWHLFPGMKIEAKYDGRIANDVTVIGAAQFDRRKNGMMHLLVQDDVTGERITLSGYSNQAYYATVTPIVHSSEAFRINNFFGNLHRAS